MPRICSGLAKKMFTTAQAVVQYSRKQTKGYLMVYTKAQLEEIAICILGSNPVVALGLPRAAEECAVQLFLNPEAHMDAVEVIRKAVLDIREFGNFKFAVKK